jgi:hypothetical protein
MVSTTRYNQTKTIKSCVAESLQPNLQQQKAKPIKSILKPSIVTKMRYLNTSTSSSLLPITTNSKKMSATENNTSRDVPKGNDPSAKASEVPRQNQTASTESRKMALLKQTSSPSLISSNSIPKVAPKGASMSTPIKPASLQSLKAKFAAKSSTDNSSNFYKANNPSIEKNQNDLRLPWNEYTVKRKQDLPVYLTETNDYDKMIQELSVSHAMMAANSFETMCFVEADQLNKVNQENKKKVKCFLTNETLIETCRCTEAYGFIV